jgi:hypothetical protein
MKATILAAAAALSLSFAGASAAADRIVAQLESPVAAKTKIVAGGAVWTCDGASCSAVAQSSRSTSVRACQSLAKEVGRVTTFGAERGPFAAEKLSECNTAAASQAAPAVTQTAAN